MGSRQLPRQRGPTASSRGPAHDTTLRSSAVTVVLGASCSPYFGSALFYQRSWSFTDPRIPLAGGHFRSFRRGPYKARARGKARTGSFRCIPIHTSPSNVVCATLVRYRNPPFAPSAVPVIVAALSRTTGRERLSGIELAIKSGVFAGTFTDMQAIVPANDPARPLATKLTTDERFRPYAPTALWLGGTLTLGLGRVLSHWNPSFES
jgi:hypothetical protein